MKKDHASPIYVEKDQGIKKFKLRCTGGSD